MRRMPWKVIKSLLIAFLCIGVLKIQVGNSSNANRLGIILAIVAGAFGLFQLFVWIFHDIVTLKRGGWILPKFDDPPLANRAGPGLILTTEAVSLITFGFLKIIAAVVQGAPSAIFGAWLVMVGFSPFLWQKFLTHLFRSRFSGSNHSS